MSSVAVVFQRSVYEPKTRDHEDTKAGIHENMDHHGSPQPVVMFSHVADRKGVALHRKRLGSMAAMQWRAWTD